MVDQPAILGSLLPDFYWVYGPAFDVDASHRTDNGQIINNRRQFGTMILSRWPIMSSRLHTFPKLESINNFNMDLGALEGIIDTPAKPLRVYSLHLNAHSTRERLMQIEMLMKIHQHAAIGGGAWSGPDAIGEDDWAVGEKSPPMPSDSILLGDFNTIPNSTEYDYLVGISQPGYGRIYHVDGFVDSWAVVHGESTQCITWHPDKASPESDEAMRLDYCFLSSSLAQSVTNAWVDLTAAGSDHYPYWTELAV